MAANETTRILYRQIRAQVLDSSSTLSDALRAAIVLADALNYAPLMNWARLELEGYQTDDDLPHYRIFETHVRGNFAIGAMRIENAFVPNSNLPAEWHDELTHVYLRESTANLEATSLRAPEPEIHISISADFVKYHGYSFLPPAMCSSAWRSLSLSDIDSMLDRIRTGLLMFVMDVEKLDPSLGIENEGHFQTEKISHSFTTNILGGISNVAVGSTGVTQHSIVDVRPHDLDSLKRYLGQTGIDKSDLLDLEASLERDAAEANATGFGPHASKWMGRMLTRAADGTWDVGVGTAGNLLADALARFLGIGG
ncbi:hypothetical protein BH24CHL1_BH24CHL1_01320 [soil metagenome]